MTKRFEIHELQKQVDPYDLIDVLDELLDKQIISGYFWDYVNGTVDIDLSTEAEVLMMFKQQTGGLH